MSYIPMILVVGDPRLNSDLSATLPQGSCRVVHCDTPQQALDQATNAAVVLINVRVAGAEPFCRRLRADPITGSIPLLVRGGTHQGAPWADEVLSGDLQQTVDVLQTYLPELLDPNAYASADEIEELDEDALFDIDESTVIWRRPEGVDDWPQPPPEHQPNEDVLDYTRGYAGYVNSLVEAYNAPELYSAAQHVRLDEMSHRVVGGMDATLSAIQNAINDALRGGDLQRMRELSAGKNVLFEKLQQLRSIQNSNKKRPAAASPGPAPSAPAPASSTPPGGADFTVGAPPAGAADLGMTGPTAPAPADDDDDEPGPRTTGPHTPPSVGSSGLETTGPQRKSRLTIAAEAKDKERAQTIAREAAARRAAAAKAGSARTRPGGGGDSVLKSRVLWLSIVALLVVGGGVAYFLTLDSGPTMPERSNNNRSPLMRYVTIQETPGAVVARPRAEDPDGDRVSYSIRWSVDGTLVKGANTTRLPKKHYRVGQSVVVEVTPSDSEGPGQPMASQPLAITGKAGRRNRR